MILTYDRNKSVIVETSQKINIFELFFKYKALKWNSNFIYVTRKFRF
jgi:hypothetical protein